MDTNLLFVADNPKLDPVQYFPDSRYNHPQQIQERLNFLRFLLKVGFLGQFAKPGNWFYQSLQAV